MTSKTFAALTVILILTATSLTAQTTPATELKTDTTKNYPSHYHTIKTGGVNIFYREAGPKDAPVILLMHGYPTSSFMFRNLIPILSKQ
jgi:hypothetical protein